MADDITPACVLNIAYGGPASAEDVADAIRWVAASLPSSKTIEVRAKAAGNGFESLTRGQIHLFSFLLELSERVDKLSPDLR